MLVKKYHDTQCEDKDVLITIKKAIDASPELRSKKQLIETFITGLNDADDVMSEWHNYVVKQREEELQTIITEEKFFGIASSITFTKGEQENAVYNINTDNDLPMVGESPKTCGN